MSYAKLVSFYPTNPFTSKYQKYHFKINPLNVAIYFKKSFILLIYRQYKKMLMMLLIWNLERLTCDVHCCAHEIWLFFCYYRESKVPKMLPLGTGTDTRYWFQVQIWTAPNPSVFIFLCSIPQNTILLFTLSLIMCPIICRYPCLPSFPVKPPPHLCLPARGSIQPSFILLSSFSSAVG